MPDRWTMVDSVLQSALDRSGGERDAFVRDACGHDVALEREVRSLLASYEQAGPFLERPAIEAVAEDLAAEQRVMTEERESPLAGSVVSHYRIVERLGSGGMGVVYKAEDERLRRFVALKFVSDQFSRDPDAVSRFEREARTASALNHQNICTIHDVGEHGGHPFIVMEHLEGVSLKERISEGPLGPEQAVSVAIDILNALDAAHGAGIVHRDIKPANIFITRHGRVKILDFGIAGDGAAIASGDGVTSNAAQARVVAGTKAYMAPEQFRGEAVDRRADLWAFGIVLHEMVTGRRPGPGAGASVRIPQPLERVIARCLEPDRDRRYQQAADVRADLAAIAPGATRGWVRWSLAAAAVVAVAVAGLTLSSNAGALAGRASPGRSSPAFPVAGSSAGPVRSVSVGEPPEPTATPAPPARPVNPAAREAYLWGRYYWFSGSNFDQTQSYFRQAIDLQSDYAPAWAGLADTYTQDEDHPGVASLAGQAARKAVELDDALPDAHLSLGAVYFFGDWDLTRADAEVRRALALDPALAEAHHLRGYVLAAQNRGDEALAEQRRSIELDSFARPWAVGRALMFARQFDAAVDELRVRDAVRPGNTTTMRDLSRAYWHAGMWRQSVDEMVRYFRATHEDASAKAVRRAFDRGGWQRVAEWLLGAEEARARTQHVPPMRLAYAAARLGRTDATLAYLEAAYREHSKQLVFLQAEPIFDFLHDDERFRSLVKRVGLPAR